MKKVAKKKKVTKKKASKKKPRKSNKLHTEVLDEIVLNLKQPRSTIEMIFEGLEDGIVANILAHPSLKYMILLDDDMREEFRKRLRGES